MVAKSQSATVCGQHFRGSSQLVAWAERGGSGETRRAAERCKEGLQGFKNWGLATKDSQRQRQRQEAEAEAEERTEGPGKEAFILRFWELWVPRS